jgi:uncharacterized protein
MTDTDLTIRCAGKHDEEFVLAANEANVEVLSPMDEGAFEMFLKSAEIFLAAEVSGKPAGFLIALREGNRVYGSENYRWFCKNRSEFIYIDRVVIDGGFRGMKIGQKLYSAVFDRAAETGVSCVTAEIDIIPYNEASLKFHEAMGFHEAAQQYVRGGTVKVSLQEKKI